MVHLTFFHGGGGETDYTADGKLVASLKDLLGNGYAIHYPMLVNSEAPDFGRRDQIREEISTGPDDVLLVAHSLGASMLLACLSEVPVTKKIRGLFLLATPFWSGQEDWVIPLKLQPDFEKHLDVNIPLYFYHCRDDEEVPFDHLAHYKQRLPWAKFREISAGGHEFKNVLYLVANDIQSLCR